MGLDITSYENVILSRPMSVAEANDEDYDPGETETLLYVDHPSRTQHDGMIEGAYSYKGETYSFRAVSYSGYNHWRSELARLTGTTDEAIWAARERDPSYSGPFVELINFADNEGFIGPKTAGKLAADFDAYDGKAFSFKSDLKWFYELYEDWRKAFHLAARGGAVQFR